MYFKCCNYKIFRSSVQAVNKMAVVTLQQLASKPAAEQVAQWGGAHTMLDYHAELLVCHFTGQPLVKYIQAKGGLWVLKDLFTQRGFQSLLIQVLKECDNKKIKINKMPQEFFINMLYSATFMMDGVWQMRIFMWHQRTLFGKKHDYFLEENNSCVSDRIYPALTFDKHLLMLIPNTQKKFQHRRVTRFEEWSCERTFLPTCPDAKSTVYTFLRAMAFSSRKLRWHKVLAYGFYLLAQWSVLFDPETRWYALAIFGKLAVALANLQAHHTVTNHLLNQMDQFYRFPSCTFQSMLYHQKVYAASGKYKLEKAIFDQLYTQVPRQSLIWADTCKVHFLARIAHVENILALILLRKKYYTDTEKDE